MSTRMRRSFWHPIAKFSPRDEFRIYKVFQIKLFMYNKCAVSDRIHILS